MSALLKGRALDVYDRLSVDDAADYEKLKEAFLKNFDMTERGFRKKFRHERPEKSETFIQFSSRLRSYLNKWLKMAKIKESYEAVCDFFARDQFLDSCNRELYVHLKPKSFKNLEEMAKEADLFGEARGGVYTCVNKAQRDNKGGSQHKSESKPSGKPEKKCSICGKGHLTIKCYKNPDRKQAYSAEVGVGASGYGGSKGSNSVPKEEAQAMQSKSDNMPRGLFQFRTMPFGLVNSGATFCRLMRIILSNLPNVDSFVDDMWIFTETWRDHMTSLRQVLDRLRSAKLTAKPSKCMIGYDSIECLGHNIVGQTVRPQEDKIQAIRDAPRPSTKRQIKSFLGLAGFYRRFIPNFSSIASPLTDLTKKNRPNSIKDWQDHHERAFQTLKNRLKSSPILRLPVFQEGKPFVLRTDASDIGLGAVLLQDFEGEGRLPIAYASKKLLPRERNYSVIEKECLGIIWGVEKLRKYLYGVEFLLETNHKPLSYMQTA